MSNVEGLTATDSLFVVQGIPHMEMNRENGGNKKGVKQMSCTGRTETPQKNVCVCVHMYIHLCIYIYIYIHIYTHIYTYIHTYIYIHTHIYIHTYTYIYIHIYIYTYIHVYTYIHMYIHIYIHMCIHIHIYRERGRGIGGQLGKLELESPAASMPNYWDPGVSSVSSSLV